MRHIILFLSLIQLTFQIHIFGVEKTDKASVILPENKENLWVFVLAGQSNMAGRGNVEPQDTVTNNRILTIDKDNNWILAKEPLHFYEPKLQGLDCGLSFAKSLLKKVPDSVTIAVIPCAVGGSSIYQWLGDSTHRGVKLLSNIHEKINLANEKGVVKGILWHQGESNAKPNEIPWYKNDALKLFGMFRQFAGNKELPVILGELGRFAQPEERKENFDGINSVINTITSENNNCYVVSSKGLKHKGDNLHFNSASQRKLGKRYAKAYYKNVIKSNEK